MKAWDDRMLARPAVEKGRHVPEPHRVKEVMKDKALLEKHSQDGQKWIQEGQKKDAEKK